MCLEKVCSGVSVDAPPLKREAVGWKVFGRGSGRGNLCGDWHNIGIDYPIGRWIASSGGLIYYPFGPHSTYTPEGHYTRGFHAFTRRKDAEWWRRTGASTHGQKIRKVKLRNVRTIGRQNGVLVIVADSMLIVPAKRKKAKR